MKSKTAILPLVAVGGVAAALFGGGAVSTAFTSNTSGTVTASAAKVNASISDPTFSVSGLTPGGPPDTTTMTYTDNSTTPVNLYLTNVGYTSTDGTNGVSAPDSELIMDITVPALNDEVLYDGPVSGLVGQNTSLFTGASGSPTFDIAFSLPQTAGDEWNGATATITYTLHTQDSSGSDANNFAGSTSNP